MEHIEKKPTTLIGISGKMGSGKDTVGQIFQYLNTSYYKEGVYTFEECLEYIKRNDENWRYKWEIKKFADKLKDIVCMLIGCTKDQLEDRNFKNSDLGEKWSAYWYLNKDGSRQLTLSKEEAEKHSKAYYGKTSLTPRKFLQLLGTEYGRKIIHPNIWVNALFNDYKCTRESIGMKIINTSGGTGTLLFAEPVPMDLPSWIITDVRFPNEAQAIKDRGGILIRVNRDFEKEYCYDNQEVYEILLNLGYTTFDSMQYETAINEGFEYSESLDKWCLNSDNHESEIALDNHTTWDYVINNNGTVEDLVNKVIQINEKIDD